jgi:PAS domain S-box-containing protein
MIGLTADEAQRLARFALDHADQGAFWADAEGHLLYANATAVASLGYTVQELLSLTLQHICPELTPALWKQFLKEVRSQDKFAFELTMQSRDGRGFSVEMTVHHITLESGDVFCGFFRDVNELKRLQQLKNEFVSTVSHELRTPMTIIRESVSQLLDGLLGDVAPAQKEALYVTLSGIDRLARIINDLLDVSKMEAGKATLRWDRINLIELVREVVETFSSRARERGLELRAAVPPKDIIVYADYDRLHQVFTNLVGNALKFSEKGRIEISIAERDTEIECTVADSGIGIAKEDLGRVFNKFEQLSTPAVTGEKGSGLGLSICKGIIELHQGHIWAESTPGQGSRFIFTLPKRSAFDLFQRKISAELAQAVSAGGHLTGVWFAVDTKRQDARKSATITSWALGDLVDTLQSQGVRKTDFVLRDDQGVWVALWGMTKKEAARIIERVKHTYSATLEKNDISKDIQVIVRSVSFPEDTGDEAEFMTALIGQSRDHAA